MSWTTAGDLKAQVRRLWERGELLRSMVSPGADAAPDAVLVAREEAKVGLRSGCAFPLRLVLKGPASAELTERFQAVREWIAECRPKLIELWYVMQAGQRPETILCELLGQDQPVSGL